MAPKRNAALEAMIEEATVDAYNEDEQLTGLYTMIEDNLTVPFPTTVLGVEVTVKKVDLTDDNIVAICVRGRDRPPSRSPLAHRRYPSFPLPHQLRPGTVPA